MTETRTQKPDYADRWISNPLQYHYGTIPCSLLILLTWCEWPESNRHDRSREILSLLCLPISPHSQLNWRTSRDSNPDEQFWRLSCCHYIRDTSLAEAKRFELLDPFEPSVFKTGAINRTLPHFHNLAPRVRIERTTSSLTAKRNYLCAIGELIGCGGRIRTCDLQLMRLAGTARLPYSAIIGAPQETRTLTPFDNRT